MQHPRVADFLDALVGSSRRMTVTATVSSRRTAIDIKPASEFPPPLQTPVGDLFSGIFSDVTGRVITTGLEASLRSAERQTELDQRIIPGIPSDFQAGYLVLVLLGLFGVPISRAWWRRLWPPESRGEYAGRTGYLAARAVRGGVFLLLFLPLTGWALVSASPFNIPTVLYGVIPWPHLPVLSALEDKAPVEHVLKIVHGRAAWLLMALVLVHAGAAFRHHFILRDGILRRMLPAIARKT